MTLSFYSIVKQMKKELDSLEEASPKEEFIAKMYAVKSLADVIIHSKERSADKDTSHTITDAEAKAMGIKKKETPQKKSLLDDDDANGESIFDF